MVSTTNEIVLFCWLLVDMVVYLSCLTPMYYDKKSIVQIAYDSIIYKKTKHIENDFHLSRHHL